MARHREVDVAGELDEPVDEVELAGAPGRGSTGRPGCSGRRRPGPGRKGMNPNGLVAAASMTSQTSRPIRSHSSASWLTSAMLTLRNTFSSSLASSAASGDESSWTVVVDAAQQRGGARGALPASMPPTRRGTVRAAARRVAGVDPLRARRRGRSRVPATRPDALEPLRGTGRWSCPGTSSTGGRPAGPARRRADHDGRGAQDRARGPGPWPR